VASAGWTVQLGSFANKANAESLTRQLKAEGFNAYIAPIGTAAAQRFRVRLGPIADRAAAAGIMAKLQAHRHASTLLPPSE
jgi:DedD protein